MVLKISFRSDFSDCSGSVAFSRHVTSVPSSEFTWIRIHMNFGRQTVIWEIRGCWKEERVTLPDCQGCSLKTAALPAVPCPSLPAWLPMVESAVAGWILLSFTVFQQPPPCCRLEKRDLHEWTSPSCLPLISAHWGRAAEGPTLNVGSYIDAQHI